MIIKLPKIPIKDENRSKSTRLYKFLTKWQYNNEKNLSNLQSVTKAQTLYEEYFQSNDLHELISHLSIEEVETSKNSFIWGTSFWIANTNTNPQSLFSSMNDIMAFAKNMHWKQANASKFDSPQSIVKLPEWNKKLPNTVLLKEMILYWSYMNMFYINNTLLPQYRYV